MKISIAQIRPIKGDVLANIEAHKRLINLAIDKGVDIIVFPELSLTGYEPKLAHQLAIEINDNQINIFQKIANKGNIIIALGMPLKTPIGIQIGMLIFQPNLPRISYAKQHLHEDEYPYFVAGKEQVFLNIHPKIAFAICYESLLPKHAQMVHEKGATIYIASVAKSTKGIQKAMDYFPIIAKQYAMPVLMANCLGTCDDFESVGQSSIWNKNGVLIAQLDDKNEGILIFETPKS